MSRALPPVPRWAVYSTWLLSLVGLGLAVYLTVAHFAGSQILACSDSGLVNCAKVTTSAQSYFLGVPVAVLGLASFVVFSIINSPWAWRSSNYAVHVGRVALSVGAMAFVLWLIYAELMIINNICLYCTGVHVVTFALFVVMMRVAPAQLGSNRSAAQ